jgi:hypothetical protein
MFQEDQRNLRQALFGDDFDEEYDEEEDSNDAPRPLPMDVEETSFDPNMFLQTTVLTDLFYAPKTFPNAATEDVIKTIDRWALTQTLPVPNLPESPQDLYRISIDEYITEMSFPQSAQPNATPAPAPRVLLDGYDSGGRAKNRTAKITQELDGLNLNITEARLNELTKAIFYFSAGEYQISNTAEGAPTAWVLGKPAALGVLDTDVESQLPSFDNFGLPQLTKPVWFQGATSTRYCIARQKIGQFEWIEGSLGLNNLWMDDARVESKYLYDRAKSTDDKPRLLFLRYDIGSQRGSSGMDVFVPHSVVWLNPRKNTKRSIGDGVAGPSAQPKGKKKKKASATTSATCMERDLFETAPGVPGAPAVPIPQINTDEDNILIPNQARSAEAIWVSNRLGGGALLSAAGKPTPFKRIPENWNLSSYGEYVSLGSISVENDRVVKSNTAIVYCACYEFDDFTEKLTQSVNKYTAFYNGDGSTPKKLYRVLCDLVELDDTNLWQPSLKVNEFALLVSGDAEGTDGYRLPSVQERFPDPQNDESEWFLEQLPKPPWRKGKSWLRDFHSFTNNTETLETKIQTWFQLFQEPSIRVGLKESARNAVLDLSTKLETLVKRAKRASTFFLAFEKYGGLEGVVAGSLFPIEKMKDISLMMVLMMLRELAFLQGGEQADAFEFANCALLEALQLYAQIAGRAEDPTTSGAYEKLLEEEAFRGTVVERVYTITQTHTPEKREELNTLSQSVKEFLSKVHSELQLDSNFFTAKQSNQQKERFEFDTFKSFDTLVKEREAKLDKLISQIFDLTNQDVFKTSAGNNETGLIKVNILFQDLLLKDVATKGFNLSLFLQVAARTFLAADRDPPDGTTITSLRNIRTDQNARGVIYHEVADIVNGTRVRGFNDAERKLYDLIGLYSLFNELALAVESGTALPAGYDMTERLPPRVDDAPYSCDNAYNLQGDVGMICGIRRARERLKKIEDSKVALHCYQFFNWMATDLNILRLLISTGPVEGQFSQAAWKSDENQKGPFPKKEKDTVVIDELCAPVVDSSSGVDSTFGNAPPEPAKDYGQKVQVIYWTWILRDLVSGDGKFIGSQKHGGGMHYRSSSYRNANLFCFSEQTAESLKKGELSVGRVENRFPSTLGVTTVSERLFAAGGFLDKNELSRIHSDVFSILDDDAEMQDADDGDEQCLKMRMTETRHRQFVKRFEIFNELLYKTRYQSIMVDSDGEQGDEQGDEAKKLGKAIYNANMKMKSASIAIDPSDTSKLDATPFGEPTSDMKFLHFKDLAYTHFFNRDDQFCPFTYDDLALYYIDVKKEFDAFRESWKVTVPNDRQPSAETIHSMINEMNRYHSQLVTVYVELNVMLLKTLTLVDADLKTTMSDISPISSNDQQDTLRHDVQSRYNLPGNNSVKIVVDSFRARLASIKNAAKEIVAIRKQLTFLSKCATQLWSAASTGCTQRFLKNKHLVGYEDFGMDMSNNRFYQINASISHSANQKQINAHVGRATASDGIRCMSIVGVRRHNNSRKETIGYPRGFLRSDANDAVNKTEIVNKTYYPWNRPFPDETVNSNFGVHALYQQYMLSQTTLSSTDAPKRADAFEQWLEKGGANQFFETFGSSIMNVPSFDDIRNALSMRVEHKNADGNTEWLWYRDAATFPENTFLPKATESERLRPLFELVNHVVGMSVVAPTQETADEKCLIPNKTKPNRSTRLIAGRSQANRRRTDGLDSLMTGVNAVFNQGDENQNVQIDEWDVLVRMTENQNVQNANIEETIISRIESFLNPLAIET